MSLYRPDPKTLYPARLADGWWVMDKFGRIDGPYATISGANASINAEENAEDDDARRLGRHPSYGEG